MKKKLNREQTKVIKKLTEVWSKYPYLRFGQLISNVTGDYEDTFYVTDIEFLDLLDMYKQFGL